MALFQRKPQLGEELPYYTVGFGETYLVIGLGNPGKKYDGTRHNAGYAAVDYFAEKNDFPAWTVKKDLQCRLSNARVGPARVILCKPDTFMNNSGQAAQAAQRFYKLANSRILAVYDEMAIPFGQLRTRSGGSDAGHNGVKSMIAHLGDDFNRLRIGIGGETSAKAAAAGYVLAKFSKSEQAAWPQVMREANSFINEFIAAGAINPETRKIM